MERREFEKMGLFPIGQSYIINCLLLVNISTYSFSFVVRGVKYSIMTTMKKINYTWR